MRHSCCTCGSCAEFLITTSLSSFSVTFSLFSRCPPGVNLAKKGGAERRRVQVFHLHRSVFFAAPPHHVSDVDVYEIDAWMHTIYVVLTRVVIYLG